MDETLRDVMRSSGTGRNVTLVGVTRGFVARRGLAGDYELVESQWRRWALEGPAAACWSDSDEDNSAGNESPADSVSCGADRNAG